MKQKTLGMIVGGAIVVIVAVFVFLLFSSTNKETEVSIQNGTITFSGQYGASYSLADLVEVQKVDSIPTILARTNGAAIGEIKKGNFTVDGLGTCRLYVMSAAGPYLILKFKTNTVIVNFKDAQKTETLYTSLT
jgi:hypothetical protein